MIKTIYMIIAVGLITLRSVVQIYPSLSTTNIIQTHSVIA